MYTMCSTYFRSINLACSVCVLYLKHTALSSHTCLHFLVNLPCCRYCCCIVWGELLCQWKSGPVLQTAPLPPSHPRVELLGPHPPCGTYVRKYNYIHACACACAYVLYLLSLIYELVLSLTSLCTPVKYLLYIRKQIWSSSCRALVMCLTYVHTHTYCVCVRKSVVAQI